MFRRKNKLDKLYIEVFTESKKGVSRGKSYEVTKTAKKNIYKIKSYNGDTIIVEVS